MPKSKKPKTKARERFYTIDVKGTRILVMNYSHAGREEVWKLTRTFDAWISKQKPNSVNVLFEIKDAYYEPTHVNHWKKSLGRYDTYIRKSCFVNPPAFFMLIVPTLRAFAALVGVSMKKDRGVFFKDRDEAIAWLAAP